MSSFTDLGVPADLVAALAARGIVKPFPIQALTVPDACAGRDLCGRAPTGSGKTIAFGIPLITRLSRGSARRPRGLVLAPTRELAAQVSAELAWLGATRNLRVAAVYGGASFGPQLQALRRGTEVVVACPGRLTDLLGRGDVDLREIEMVVVDEADRMADMGFLPSVRRLLDCTPKSRQTLLFSATLDGAVDVLVRHYQRDPVRHVLTETNQRATHAFWNVERDSRVELTADVIRRVGPTIVFCRTKHGTDTLAKKLRRLGVQSEAIHGNRSQAQRERALASFSQGHAEALIATDVAARGIHVDDVECVLHFDLPADAKDYTHRAGRTARAGASGRVVTFVSRDQSGDASRLRRDLGLSVPVTSPEVDALTAASAEAEPVVAALVNSCGVVKWFNQRRGFGFIGCHDGPDVFVHHSAIVADFGGALEAGQHVAFEIGRGRQGDEATRVRLVAASGGCG